MDTKSRREVSDQYVVVNMLWSMVSKAAERPRRKRHGTFCNPIDIHSSTICGETIKGLLFDSFCITVHSEVECSSNMFKKCTCSCIPSK